MNIENFHDSEIIVRQTGKEKSLNTGITNMKYIMKI